MMKLLPVHLLKLRWLLANWRLLDGNDHALIQNMQQDLSKVNYLVACPVTISALERVYDKVKDAVCL
jgi:hypothetical protein